MSHFEATIDETPLNTLLNRLSDPSREISNMSSSALNQTNRRAHITKPSALDSIITSSDLEEAAKCMRRNNVTLISKSLRTHLYCLDNIDIQKFEPSTDFIVNFISKGSSSCSGSILRPVSILWPSKYDELVEQLAVLDAFLLNSEFRDRPVEWLIRRGLIQIPDCHQCKAKMTLFNEAGKIIWVCEATQACANYSMPVLRPTLFASFEHVGLDKLLYSLYYWATCTPAEELYDQMELDPEDLNGIWAKLQNICRATLEKAYPRHRLTNNLDPHYELNPPSSPTVPIDLVSIKLNQHYIICAKHPDSNLVRLGILTPHTSNYSFSDLTQTWFAHGSHIRVSESKFLSLKDKRADMKIDQVTRVEMISKNGCFDRMGAFGYMITQLAHLFKDQDSTSVSSEQLKMLLAEMQWRELYGVKPYESFVNMIAHMTQYGHSSLYYSEPDLGVERPSRLTNQNSATENDSVYVWTESYYYAEFIPKKYLTNGNGKSNRNNQNQVVNQQSIAPDVKLTCHHCNQTFNNFEFCMHLIGHLERSRLIDQRPESPNNKTEIECKHCFKTFDHEQVAVHSALFRTNYMLIQYSCRICCIHLKTRSKFIEHMRHTHFQHETPYHCPFCDYAASIQRDVLIHFHEKHRQQMVLLCPLCFREFTVAKPESMNRERMRDLSRIIYDHLLKHYSVSRTLTCSSCCLCFAESKQLAVHRKLHHNPLQTRQEHLGTIKPYIVDEDDKRFCVKALRIELFIANKEPNANLQAYNNNCPSSSSSDSSTTSSDGEEKEQAKRRLLVVRGINGADKLLASGSATLKVGKVSQSGLSSQKIIDLFSNSALKRADGVVATQSVVLSPAGQPVKCGECLEYITEDHFVASITCKPCQYSTHCPLAATRHHALDTHKQQQQVEATD